MDTQPPKKFIFERIAGGDGCELSVVRIPVAGDDGKPGRPPHYAANEDLPADVRASLPAVAQTLYRETYNHAWNNGVRPVLRGFEKQRDEAARRAAWAAVRRLYVYRGNTWVRRKLH